MATTETLKFTQGFVNNWLIKRRWWLIGFVGVSLFYLELYEDAFKPLDWFHLLEYLLYVVFLIIIGILISLLTRVLGDQVRNLTLLDYKHKIDREIIAQNDWIALTEQLVKLPATIAPVGAASLFVVNPITNRFEFAAQKIEGVAAPPANAMEALCSVCIAELIADQRLLIQCSTQPAADPDGRASAIYCLAIRDIEQIHAILVIRMLPGRVLNDEQKNILEMIAEDLLVALKAGQDRKMLVELREVEARLNERRKVSHFLHDSLGQNLSFINLKVSQLIAEYRSLPSGVIRRDLERVLDAAGASHDIVRGILEGNQSGTMPLLSNLLIEHGTNVALRANFKVEFDIKGEPVSVPTEIQHAVFYVFQEAFSNIEKHAHAKNVKVDIFWGANDLDIVIEDNGLGFTPGEVDFSHHLGLSIMQERIDRVNGHIELNSSPSAGTIVKICVPISIKSLQMSYSN